MKNVLISILILFSLVSSSFAICYQKVMSAANRDSTNGMALGCYDEPPLYTPTSGCTVDSSAMQGCLAVYQICCQTEIVRYETGAPHVDVLTGVDVGSEFEAAMSFYEDMQQNGYAAPACDAGFRSTWEGKGMIHKVQTDPADLTKSKVQISTFYRQGCESFSNMTSAAYTPIGSVGSGSGSGGTGSTTVTVDMTATNDLLAQVKAAIIAAGGPTDMTGTNDLLGQIKASIDSLALTGGGSGGSTDMTGTNDLLTTIKNGIVAGNLNSTETNSLLTLIKDNLAAGSGGGTGGTANVDMTATNGILGGIKEKIDFLYDSITGFFNTGGDSGSVDALSTAGVPTEGDLTGGDLETRMRSQLKEKFEFEGKKTALDIYKEHQKEWGKSDLFLFVNNLNVQMAASLPVWNLSLPRWGVNYTFDLGNSHWSYIFGVVRTLVIIGATIMAYKIIFRAGA